MIDGRARILVDGNVEGICKEDWSGKSFEVFALKRDYAWGSKFGYAVSSANDRLQMYCHHLIGVDSHLDAETDYAEMRSGEVSKEIARLSHTTMSDEELRKFAALMACWATSLKEGGTAARDRRFGHKASDLKLTIG